ncbi:hypothetical protein DF185_04390 [Marinifilum breve]|uniref:Uncharacterized protein n=1 Tax=Marinifilum breve TaxID=2184082 RepID=A0A2V3ZZH2_9BACT|nr:hypothetical protein [Marinifilum breve]PXY01892.1 hypothetical protein DF185_04390 [Marinifilum breve]
MNLNNQDKIDVNQLIGKLQKSDKNYADICKALKAIYWVLTPLYLIMTIVFYIDTKEINNMLAGIAMISCFVIFLVILNKYQKEYNGVDYSLPTLLMLKKAAERYQPFRPESIWAIIAIILMDIGFYINSFNKIDFLNFHIYSGSIIILSIIVGLIIWYNKYKPLRDNALASILEIEGE